VHRETIVRVSQDLDLKYVIEQQAGNATDDEA